MIAESAAGVLGSEAAEIGEPALAVQEMLGFAGRVISAEAQALAEPAAGLVAADKSSAETAVAVAAGSSRTPRGRMLAGMMEAAHSCSYSPGSRQRTRLMHAILGWLHNQSSLYYMKASDPAPPNHASL